MSAASRSEARGDAPAAAEHRARLRALLEISASTLPEPERAAFWTKVHPNRLVVEKTPA